MRSPGRARLRSVCCEPRLRSGRASTTSGRVVDGMLRVPGGRARARRARQVPKRTSVPRRHRPRDCAGGRSGAGTDRPRHLGACERTTHSDPRCRSRRVVGPRRGPADRYERRSASGSSVEPGADRTRRAQPSARSSPASDRTRRRRDGAGRRRCRDHRWNPCRRGPGAARSRCHHRVRGHDRPNTKARGR